MDLQSLAIAAVSTLSGVLGKVVVEHVVQRLSPTARLKRAEVAQKPTVDAALSLLLSSKDADLGRTKEELRLAEDAHEALSRAHAHTVQELSDVKRELQRARDYAALLKADNEKLIREGARRPVRPERVQDAHRVERVRGRKGEDHG